ncbi:hypothetical protein P152DRAFT_133471 [Eremomyces bilateralis CBS 781.70]|uniref:Uncharacterized protein n=1 Tax=Eremomyces bilateralis CBS 781.70 TaxID=1392243 RepID=A0A6G1GFM5_9PEZI|nr:uncharacterized protein P152DRAFT_133471 [Eremomyces bilateralis CBS 781.70]KAF1816679.1 hypothetical protein P152DRAFT_133471 [Eremomyces bilateralis CBS 781.70]
MGKEMVASGRNGMGFKSHAEIGGGSEIPMRDEGTWTLSVSLDSTSYFSSPTVMIIADSYSPLWLCFVFALASVGTAYSRVILSYTGQYSANYHPSNPFAWRLLPGIIIGKGKRLKTGFIDMPLCLGTYCNYI